MSETLKGSVSPGMDHPVCSSLSQASHAMMGDSPSKASDANDGGIFMTNLPNVADVDQSSAIAERLRLYN